jgi:hypothetical protein
VDMQVRPVRMKESRYFAPSSPGGLGCGDTPLAALPSEGCPHVLSSANPAQIASKSHDPSMRTVYSPPGLSADRPGDEKATSQITRATFLGTIG